MDSTKPSADPSATPSVQDSDLFRLLVRCAVSLVASGGTKDGLSYQERQQVMTTRLISGSQDSSTFTLPIFQQWFAAQALLEDDVLLKKAISTPQKFDRWRWSLSIAGMSAPSAEAFDGFFLLLMEANPGAAAWVLDQISSARDWSLQRENDFVDSATAGKRLLTATRSWVDATKELSPELFPITHVNAPISLRIGVQQGRITTVWNRCVPEHDTVENLEPTFNPASSSDWRFVTSQNATHGYEWPWTIQQRQVAQKMSNALGKAYKLGPDGGIWHSESRYRLARLVMNERSVFFTPIDRADLLDRLTELLNRIESPEDSSYIFRRNEVPGTNLLDLYSWADSTSSSYIHRPLPTPDQDPQDGWVRNGYSEKGLLNFIAAAYGNACVAYDDARDAAFASFDWSMGTGHPREFGVIAIVKASDDSASRHGGPTLTKTLVPLPRIARESLRFGNASKISDNGRALIINQSTSDLTDSDNSVHDYIWSLTEPESQVAPPPFDRRSVTHQLVDFTSNSRAATAIACRWLWNDLKALKLTTGTVPRFE